VVLQGIYSDIHCQLCDQQKERESSDELYSDVIGKVLPHVTLDPEGLAQCLELQPTLVNEDNIFNCVFGRKDMFGTFICSDGSTLRKELAESLGDLKERYKTKLLDALFQFVQVSIL
jgi:hypothetical protein